MNYFTRASRRCGLLAGRRRRAALIALASLIVLVTACGGTSTGAQPTAGNPLGSTVGPHRAGLHSPAGETPAVGPKSATTGGALFGGNAAQPPAEVYYQLGEPFPVPSDQQLMA